MEELLKGLNEAQRAAVTSEAKVVQVLAPPGSGKTKTLTSRAAYLIAHHGFKPRNIILCTFTVKAAREMQERIRGFLGDDLASQMIVGTFHSIARRFLAMYGKFVGLEEKFGIADTSDTTSILKRIIDRLRYNIQPAQARARISKEKSRGITSEQIAVTSKSREKTEFANVYSEYEEYLKLSKLLDFDDLLLRCQELLRSYPRCVSNIEAVLIDEFQDTNRVQYQLMHLLAQSCRNITTVGDPDQSIYGWRSAEIENLQKMQQDCPDIHVALLEENYRSSGAILLTAQEIIEQDRSRPSKQLVPTHSVGMRPILRRLENADQEAQWIALEIQRIAALTGDLFSWNDFAVLLRSASLSRLVEKHLGIAAIPYRMVGGRRFFDRMEVKLVLDYLRVIDHSGHNDALARIINVPSRRIGEATITKLLAESEQRKMSAWGLAKAFAQGNITPRFSIQEATRKGLKAFVGIILEADLKLKRAQDDQTNLKEFLEHLIQRIGLEDYLRQVEKENFENKWANVQELLALAADFKAQVEPSLDPDTTEDLVHVTANERSTMGEALSSFLANVALSTEVQRAEEEEEGQSQGQVVLSTIHAAKGLEWPNVFIPAVYEGSIPHSRTEDLDEERRLLYVAMTRAKTLLYLSVPGATSTGDETRVSQFLGASTVDAYFDRYGPSFGLEAVKESALILGRAIPLPSVIGNAMQQYARIRDTDEVFKSYPRSNSKRTFDQCYEGDEMIDHGSLARLGKGVSDLQRRVWPNATAKAEQARVSYMAPTTMQGAGQFSTAKTMHTTFQSAGSVMLKLSKESRTDKRISDDHNRKVTNTHASSCTVNLTSNYGRQKSESSVASQSSLLGFLGKVSATKIETTQQQQQQQRESKCLEGRAEGSLRDMCTNLQSNVESASSVSNYITIDKRAQENEAQTRVIGKTAMGRPPAQRKTLGMRRDLVGWQPGTRHVKSGTKRSAGG